MHATQSLVMDLNTHSANLRFRPMLHRGVEPCSGPQPQMKSSVTACRYRGHTVGRHDYGPRVAEPATAPQRTKPHGTTSSSNTGPKSTSSSQTEESDKNSPDLVLPMFGLPPIPLHLVKSIKQGKYVDLPELLPEALREAQFNKSRDGKDYVKHRKRYTISTPLEWMAAFSAYTAIAVHLNPQRAFETRSLYIHNCQLSSRRERPGLGEV